MKVQNRVDGFTLAELLVALALIALIAAYAVSTLAALGNVRRVEQQIDESSAHASALRSIRITLADTRAVFDPESNGQLRLVFDGKENQISFVSTLDDHLERGGLFRMRYYLDASTQKLMLSYAVRRATDANVRDEIALLDSVSSLSFRYFGNQADEPAKWHDTWQQQDQLPRLIEVSLDENVPPLVISLAAAQ